jgi:AGCS family alanine or glycine:cation symporter
MDALNNFLLSLDGFLGSAAWFPYVLLGTGLFFTLYLGFPQIRYFRHAWSIVTGKFDRKGDEGDTSHFQALTTALSGTVGTGNIGGVALALHIGGPAALFWMWMTAFMGMTTKFVEVTLSHKYREKTADGTMAGGPMYYMAKGLNMKWMAVMFALATVASSFGTGSLPQVNNIAQAMNATFDLPHALTGGVLAILLALVIIGGIKRIAVVTSRLVPAMSVIYILGAMSVILYNIENIGPSFISIFSDAFTGSSAVGGFLGASFAYAFNKGVGRGLFSNEAGQGSAPIAHAAARAHEPVSEGMVSILEPFIDTIIICTITGLVILSSGVWTEKFNNDFQRSDMLIVQGIYDDANPEHVKQLSAFINGTGPSTVATYNGKLDIVGAKAVQNDFTVINARSIAEQVRFDVSAITPFNGSIEVKDGQLVDSRIMVSGKSLIHSAELTAEAFTRGFLGESGRYVVAIGLLLFAFSTAIAWSYYGDRAMTFLFGPKSVTGYRIVYVAGFFWASFSDTTLIWNLAAVTVVVMTLPNLLGILLLRKEMKEEVSKYWKEFKQ